MSERNERITNNTIRYIQEKYLEKKAMAEENSMEKEAFYGRRGMRSGSFLTNRATIYEEDGILYRQASTKDNVLAAWRGVETTNLTEGEKVKLRQRILAKAKELRINTKGWSTK